MWQRAAACVDGNILKSGLLRSSVGVLFSWGFLVIIAWIAVNCIQANDGVGVFESIIDHANKSFLGNIFSFLVLLGLYSAQLSTASTLLIAIAHTVTTDIFPTHNQSKGNGLAIARVSVVVGSVFSCVFVAILSSFGFNIEDLIFSIYGGALALFPPVLLALLRPRSELRRLDRFAVVAVMGGFSAGWFVAFYGKINDVQNLVFMSPAIGMGISASVLIIGVAISAGRKAGRSDT
jgi:Na+/proline symporter